MPRIAIVRPGDRTVRRRRAPGRPALIVESLEGRQLLNAGGMTVARMERHMDVHLAAAGRRLTRFVETNLVSDQPGVAPITDPQLVNGWGIGLNPTRGAFWVSDNGTGVATLYIGGTPGGAPLSKAGLVVTIPGGNPTGQVANTTAGFKVDTPSGPTPAAFIFVTESGQISAWSTKSSPITEAVQVAAVPGAVFKGVTIAQSGAGPRLYAADFHGGAIRVFDANFQPVLLAPGAFHDRRIPRNYAPFNVQQIDGKLFVTYARQDANATDEVAGRGRGFVDVFDADGRLLSRLVRHGRLDAPWGLAKAPDSFGRLAGTLLVGNFGNGRINAYSLTTGRFRGAVTGTNRRPIVIDGLWALTPGNGVSAGRTDTIYFAAGPDDEGHGLFGSLTPA